MRKEKFIAQNTITCLLSFLFCDSFGSHDLLPSRLSRFPHPFVRFFLTAYTKEDEKKIHFTFPSFLFYTLSFSSFSFPRSSKTPTKSDNEEQTTNNKRRNRFPRGSSLSIEFIGIIISNLIPFLFPESIQCIRRRIECPMVESLSNSRGNEFFVRFDEICIREKKKKKKKR